MLSDRPADPSPVPTRDVVAWLREEVGDDARVEGDLPEAVTGVSLSTSRVRPGDLYAALPGARAHGADFAAEALAAGAVLVLTDPDGAALLPDGAPALVVPRPRSLLGALAARVYGEPARDLVLVGVTGTQGKTTTTRLLEAGLAGAGTTAAVVGTNGTRVAGQEVRTTLTTPEAPDLHGLFAVMREQGVETCAMEVSSHALVLGRVDGCVFDLAVFTNLGRDHLDFHADVEDYFAAKASLFTPERARRALVNLDDPWGRRLLATTTLPTTTFSAAGDPEADWRAVDVDAGPTGSTFRLVGPGVDVGAGVPIPGDFNVANALAAVVAASTTGHDATAVAAAVAAGAGVPGRLERVEAGQDFTVVVDYAHKPDALEALLRTLRPLAPGRLVVVVGAGGDRDPGKRELMGRAAAALADTVVVTDDNPRSEDPATIRAALVAGAADGPGEVVEVAGRRDAIARALEGAGSGDIVVVAGKGHETGQVVGGTVHPFDDREVARELLAGRVAP